MDSAETDAVRAALRDQGQRLHHQEAQLGEVRQEVVEASRRNKAACVTLSDKLDVINRRQGLEQILAACPPESEASAAIAPEEPAPLSQPSESQFFQ